MKQYKRSKEKRDTVDRCMDTLYAKIAKACPGGTADSKYMGRKDSNKPGDDCRHSS